jgi:hypothetical protein
MRPESVVCWLWQPAAGYRTAFTATHVNTLRRMVARHYRVPHRFVCLTDDPRGLDDGIEVLPLWADWATVASPHGAQHPSCYRRLKAFAPEMRALGARFVSLDLDCVVTGDLTALWDREEEFVIWRPTYRRRGLNGPKTRFNGSMWLLTAGSRPEVWTRFRGAASAAEAYRRGYHGSDQGWLQYVLGTGVPGWSEVDGVYSYKFHLLDQHAGELPAHTRIVFFHGKPDCWDAEPQRRAWVQTHYR